MIQIGERHSISIIIIHLVRVETILIVFTDHYRLKETGWDYLPVVMSVL